jgi:hypothetical protein
MRKLSKPKLPPKLSLMEIVKAAAARFDQKPIYRASIEARTELQTKKSVNE